jgi:hypothetical protein
MLEERSTWTSDSENEFGTSDSIPRLTGNSQRDTSIAITTRYYGTRLTLFLTAHKERQTNNNPRHVFTDHHNRSNSIRRYAKIQITLVIDLFFLQIPHHHDPVELQPRRKHVYLNDGKQCLSRQGVLVLPLVLGPVN